MSGSQKNPWSSDPNAPKIPYDVYFGEKACFAGILIASILYGVVIILFLNCIAALFDPVHRRPGERIKWGLVSYAAAMFSIVTVLTAVGIDVQSISYVDNREYPGIEGVIPPGSNGYQLFISREALSVIPNVMFFSNSWLADGLLLYRCYVVYSMNLWVIALPCLMYLGSIAMGIAFACQLRTAPQMSNVWSALPYFSISLSLNVLLTFAIVIRLILHTRATRTALGGSGMGGLCKAIVTMLVESCALYAVSSLLVIGPWSVGSPITNFFLSILEETQVVAALLIIQRVANKSALTSNTIASGRISTFRARTGGETTGGGSTIPDGYPMSHAIKNGTSTGEPWVGVETAIGFHQDKV